LLFIAFVTWAVGLEILFGLSVNIAFNFQVGIDFILGFSDLIDNIKPHLIIHIKNRIHKPRYEGLTLDIGILPIGAIVILIRPPIIKEVSSLLIAFGRLG
jgi:hypothetical protein